MSLHCDLTNDEDFKQVNAENIWSSFCGVLLLFHRHLIGLSSPCA